MHTFGMVGSLAALIGAAGITGCATIPSCPAQGGPTWRQLSSAHFQVKTDLPLRDAEEVVATLEETRAAMLADTWGGAAGPPGRTQVIALATTNELAEFVGFGIGGVHMRAPPFPPTMLITAASFAQITTLRHELAHDLSTWFLPFQPPWFSEGMATFLETVRYERATGRAFVGEVSPERVRTIQHHGVLTMDALFGPTPGDVLELGFFETSSWVLVSYLINNRQEAFQRFQRRFGALEPMDEAWRAEFPDLDADGLYRTLVEYVRSGQYVVTRRTLPPWTAASAVRVLSDGEVHGIRAYLYGVLRPPAGGSNPERASAEIKEALRVDPGALDALIVSFYSSPALREIQKQTGSNLSRTDLADRATRAHPESWMAWLMVADAADGDVPATRTALTRALQIAPDQPEVVARMAAVKAAAGEWPAALAFAGKAMRMRATHEQLWVVYMAALAHTGHCADAALWEAAVVNYLPPPRAQRVSSQWTAIQKTCVAPPP